jgi:myosin-5
MGRTSDDTALVDLFAQQLGEKHSKHFSVAKFDPSAFVIKHYAGEVTYSSDGFLEKSRDTLHDDLKVGLGFIV